MSTPPKETTSVERNPEKLPVPYFKSNFVPLPCKTSDKELLPISLTWCHLVSGGKSGIVFVAVKAGNAGCGVTFLAWNPQVTTEGNCNSGKEKGFVE